MKSVKDKIYIKPFLDVVYSPRFFDDNMNRIRNRRFGWSRILFRPLIEGTLQTVDNGSRIV
jgi:hypothetical protein